MQREKFKVKATSHLTILRRGMSTTDKIERGNYQDLPCWPSFEGKAKVKLTHIVGPTMCADKS